MLNISIILQRVNSIFPKAADILLILGSLAVWVVALIGLAGMVRLDQVPDRTIIVFNFQTVLIAVLSALIFIINIWMSRRRRRMKEPNQIFALLRFRIAFLPALILISLATLTVFPRFAANLIFLGVPAVLAWALLILYRLPAKPETSRWSSRVDGIAILVLFGTIYWIGGVYFTQSAGEHSGDEGHYLIQAHSLYFDGDLDLHNNLGDPTKVDRAYVHISRNSLGDHWYSWHSPGLAFLLAPTVPGGIVWRHAILGFISGLTLAGMYLLARAIGSERRSAWIAVFLLGSGAFWGIYSCRALPEVLGATLTVYGLLFCIYQRRIPWLSIAPAALCIGFLPWVHTRFTPVALALLGCYGLHGVLGSERWLGKIFRLGVFTLACALVLGVYEYGQLQMFKDGLSYPVPHLLFSMPMGMWHILASNRGILFMFPVFACAWIASFYLIFRKNTRWPGVYAIVIFMSVWLTSCATVWFAGGYSLPGRFLLVVTPILMACIAYILPCSSPVFRGLVFYLGLLPSALFMAQLTVLKNLGKSFANPYNIESAHPLFTGLARFFYDPYGPVSLFPALSLYMITTLLVFWPRMSKIFQYMLAAVLMASFALCSLFPESTPPYSKRMAASALENQNLNSSFIVVTGDVTESVPLLDLSDRFDGHKPTDVAYVTTRDLGTQTRGNQISYPHLAVNDWNNRGYRWATLVPPFHSGKGQRVCYIEADIKGNSDVELVIREGSITHIEKRYAPGQLVQEMYTFETDNNGDVFLLVRFVGSEGEFIMRKLAYSAYSEALLNQANLNLAPPSQ